VANEVLSKKTNQLASEESNAGLSMSRQEEMPFAVVQGKELTALPKDLYIPPDALEIILEAFEGPLDLLLYLIRRQNLDILEIDVAEITKQYMGYIDLMSTIQLELASEYLVMAAMLAEIKSRILLPRQVAEDDDEGDPRAELIRRLQDYERFKMAAEDIDEMPRMGRDIYQASAESPDKKNEKQYSEVQMQELLMALSDVMKRAEMFESHHIQLEKLSTRERMSQILENIRDKQFVPFATLFKKSEGRLGVVVTFFSYYGVNKGVISGDCAKRIFWTYSH
jgi:segregation and condensation protein A